MVFLRKSLPTSISPKGSFLGCVCIGLSYRSAANIDGKGSQRAAARNRLPTSKGTVPIKSYAPHSQEAEALPHCSPRHYEHDFAQ